MNRIPTNKRKKEFIIVNGDTGSQVGANYCTRKMAETMAAAFRERFRKPFNVEERTIERSFALMR